MVSEDFIKKNPKTGKYVNLLITIIVTMIASLYVQSQVFGWTEKSDIRENIELKASKIELKEVEDELGLEIKAVEVKSYKYTKDQLDDHRAEDERREKSMQRQFSDMRVYQDSKHKDIVKITTLQYEDLKGDMKLILERN
jgi:hypothetical protein